MLGISAGDATIRPDVARDWSAKRPRSEALLHEGYAVPSPSTRLLPDPLLAAEGVTKRQQAKKPPLSCAECRRLKLKCDRVFPCQSCSKRGCAEICPSGVLVSGRGSRFILANTEQLHAKIMQMSDRIRYLEEALEALQSSCSSQTHPLLRPDLLLIKTSVELYSGPQSGGDAAVESQQPNAIPVPIGPLFRLPETDMTEEPSKSTADGPRHLHIPDKLLQRSRSFPVPWQVDLDTRQSIRDFLPPQTEAQLLCEQARQNALWQYNPDPSEVFLPNLLHHVYTVPLQNLCPRRVALLLMILAIGSLVDLDQPFGSSTSQMYHHLARASLCEIPLIHEPSFDLLQALFFMMWYILSFSDTKKGLEQAWTLMGTTIKLAQTITLHRDSRVGSKVIPEELERRRTLFWEIMNLDIRLSLSLGRAPSLSLLHVDCKSPSYTSKGNHFPAEGAFFHEWKHAFVLRCLSPILDVISSAVEPEYERIVVLDRTVRDFDVPSFLDIFNCEEPVTIRSVVMQRAVVCSTREIALLQLHRSYFMEALSGPEPFTLHHKFAPSVMATYRSASRLISTIELLFNQEPHLSTRFVCFWFNSFSAGVFLSLLVSRAPCSTLAPFAVHELHRVCLLFEKAKEFPMVCKMLARLLKLSEKAHHIYSRTIAFSPHASIQDESKEGILASSVLDVKPRTLSQLKSFEHVHPALWHCLEKAGPVVMPSITNPAEPIPSSMWPQAQDSHKSVDISPSTLLVDFMAPESRIDAHPTFEFEFGTLAYDLGDLDLTSWF